MRYNYHIHMYTYVQSSDQTKYLQMFTLHVQHSITEASMNTK